jgi:chromosome segregation ATPase
MVSEDKQQILDIKVKYEDAIYGIIRYKEKIDQLKASIKDLQQQEKDKTITTNEMKVQTEAINATIKEYQYNVRTLRKEIQNNVRTENEQEGSLKQLRAQLSNATKKNNPYKKKNKHKKIHQNQNTYKSNHQNYQKKKTITKYKTHLNNHPSIQQQIPHTT